MKILRVLFLLFITSQTFDAVAQVVLTEKSHAFGNIEEDSKLWFDLEVSNTGSMPTKLIRLTNPDGEFEYRFSSMDISANGKIDIRIQFNPLEKGKRKINLILYFEKETKELQITGNVKFIKRDYVSCPDFDRPSDYKTGFETTFLVLDKSNNQPIEKADIQLNDFKGNVYELECNKKGWVKERINLSYYRMVASADGYEEDIESSYVNSKKNEFTFFLHPLIAPEEITSTVPEQTIPDTEEEVLTININDEDVIEEEQTTEEMDKEENEKFSSKEYKSNNIVFLMDVSTSMKREDRLIMLKTAMNSLTDMLRTDDVITLITYATNTEILLEGEAVTDKEKIKNIINGISGQGSTSGGKGLKKAYAIAAKYFKESSNNQVFIATDGAFNIEDQKLPRLVAKQARNNIKLSVLSLRGSEFSTKKMMVLADTGKGDFVKIEDKDSAEAALKFIIKKQSKID